MKEAYKYEWKSVFSAEIEISDMKDLFCLNILKKVLKNAGIPIQYYSIFEYSDDAVCIEYDNDSWIVYNGEKGNRYNMRKNDNVIDACYELISRVSETKEEEKDILNAFKQKINSSIMDLV